MYIDRLLLQKEAPKDTKVAWGIPQGENVAVNVHVDGKWRPIAGGGSSTTVTNKYTSDPNAPMLNSDSFTDAAKEIVTKLGIDTNSKPTSEQYEQILNELKSYKFATPKQGNAVLVDYNLENQSYTFQCDDGSTITLHNEDITGLRPDIDGYFIWKTTRDKLPVRESQEEPGLHPGDPGTTIDPAVPVQPFSVKSGLLGEKDSSTEEVYTVINNNTGEIVDPLELHKLTNVIWYNYFGVYYPFYLNGIYDFELNKSDIVNNRQYISTWTCASCLTLYFTYLDVMLFYDYTLHLGQMVRIKTTNNESINNINLFFE